MEEEEELTAWHEAGHAFMAIYCGGRIERVTVEPPDDDGPVRYGDTVVRWEAIPIPQSPIFEIQVSLAGPIAESIYRGDSELSRIDQEWIWDWKNTLKAASKLRDKNQVTNAIVVIQSEIWRLFNEPNAWSAISAIAEGLLAHGTLEHDDVSEIVRFWIRRQT